MNNPNKVVIILSGGIDSTTLLYNIIRQHPYTQHPNTKAKDVYALTFDYGQKHKKEIECAKWHCKNLHVNHKIINLDFLQGSALTDKNIKIPELKTLNTKERQQPPTYVPNRNMVMLSIAASYAESINASGIFYGAQAQDEYGYWDCTFKFLNHINELLSLNRKNKIKIFAPFMLYSKDLIVKLGIYHGINYSKTWSCYNGKKKACSTCPTCVERLNAFKLNNSIDPLEYVNK